MAEINDFDIVDANNIARWPEGMTFANVNNAARADEGILARYYKDTNGSLTTTGSTNAYILAATQTLTAYYAGLRITAKANFSNTGPATINIDGLGAKALVKDGAAALVTGDIISGKVYDFVYDGTNVQVMNPTPLVVAGASTASETVEGVVEMATDAEIRSAGTGAKAMMAEDLETASAAVALTDAATVAVDWDAGINFTLTVTTNRAIGNPTNGQVGTWRTILVKGNDATLRTITFGANFLGEIPTIADCTSTKWYLLSIFCVSTTHFVVSSKRALG